LLSAPPAVAQEVPGNTGRITVLAERLATPTTVAVRNGIAFVPEGQLTRLGVVGGLFQARAVSLQGAGVINNLGLVLPGNDYFPEGIALDPVTNDLFVGSIFNGTITKFPAVGARQRFLGPVGTAGSLQRNAFGLRVDNARNLLWVCDSSLAVPGSALAGLNLANAATVVRHELPDGSLCNDVILDDAGNLLFTDSAVGQVFRVAAANALTPNSAQQFLTNPELVSPTPGAAATNGLAIAGGILFVANTNAGVLVRFDLGAADVAGSVSVVNLTEGNVANAILSGPDGVLPLSDTQLLVVENGFAGAGNNRLVRIDLDPQ
jgi:sugar lactone lactonase YvrE